jgi:hypothetical protein
LKARRIAEVGYLNAEGFEKPLRHGTPGLTEIDAALLAELESERSVIANSLTGAMRQKSNFVNRINVIWAVKSSPQKYSAFQNTQISGISLPSPPTQKGRSRSSRTLGAGCDGRGMVL